MATLFRGIIILALAFAIVGFLDLGLRSSSEPESAPAAEDAAPAAEEAAPADEAPAVDVEAQTKAVLDANNAAFEARDLDALMATYADDVSIITPDETVNGKEAARAMFEGLFNHMNESGTSSSITMVRVSPSMGYITWEMTDADGNVTKGSDTFNIDNGLITHQSVAYLSDDDMAAQEDAGADGADDAGDASADSDS